MKEIIIALILLTFFISCENQRTKMTSVAFYDSVQYIDVKDTILKRFLTAYIKENANKKEGFFEVLTSSDFVERKEYTIFKTTFVVPSDSISPLIYTKINGFIVLFYSGIDNLYPSPARLKYVRQLTNPYTYDGKMSCGNNYGNLVLCGNKLDRFDLKYEKIPTNETSCLKRACHVYFLPPKPNEDNEIDEDDE